MSTSSIALEVISSACLSPTEHLLLKHFVEKAVDPDLAAQYLMSRLHPDEEQSSEASLRSFKQDWRDLVSRCKIYGILWRISTFRRLIIHSGTI